jgi:hypothetical protein
MNRQERTSINGKHHPENHKGEGERTEREALFCININGNRSSSPECPRW